MPGRGLQPAGGQTTSSSTAIRQASTSRAAADAVSASASGSRRANASTRARQVVCQCRPRAGAPCQLSRLVGAGHSRLTPAAPKPVSAEDQPTSAAYRRAAGAVACRYGCGNGVKRLRLRAAGARLLALLPDQHRAPLTACKKRQVALRAGMEHQGRCHACAHRCTQRRADTYRQSGVEL